MRTQQIRDALTVAGVAALSLCMLGASLGIWRSLQARSFTRTALDARSLEQLTGLALGLTGALVLAWLLAGLLLAQAARLACAGGHGSRAAALARLVPRFVARLALAGLGGSVVLVACSVSAGPATAAATAGATALPQPPPVDAADARRLPDPGSRVPGSVDPVLDEAQLLDPGWVPRRVSLPLQRLVGGGNERTAAEVVVRPGDSLWAVAARHLPADATAEDISVAWPSWYAANRRAIGADPNLLDVGMVLQVPRPTQPRS